MVRFTWDPRKDRLNRQKHGVSFDEAKTVFMDGRAILIGDPDHSNLEDRFILLGVSWLGRLLVAHHVYRENDAVIHIFSARKATKRELKQYTEQNL